VLRVLTRLLARQAVAEMFQSQCIERPTRKS